MQDQSPYEGLQGDIRKLRLPEIEVWKNQYSDKRYDVEYTTAEFSSVCPKTGLPDYATIRVGYVPDKSCIELKSFKMYLLAYRDIGIFNEHAVNRILEDLVSACSPWEASVEAEFMPRGGISVRVRVEYTKD